MAFTSLQQLFIKNTLRSVDEDSSREMEESVPILPCCSKKVFGIRQLRSNSRWSLDLTAANDVISFQKGGEDEESDVRWRR